MDTDSPLTPYVAEELRALRGRHRGITFDDLETRTGVAKASLKRYFNGHRPIPMDVLDLAADALGTTAWALIKAAEEARDRAGEPAPSNVVAFPKDVLTEEEAIELEAAAKTDVSEVDEFGNDSGDQ